MVALRFHAGLGLLLLAGCGTASPPRDSAPAAGGANGGRSEPTAGTSSLEAGRGGAGAGATAGGGTGAGVAAGGGGAGVIAAGDGGNGGAAAGGPANGGVAGAGASGGGRGGMSAGASGGAARGGRGGTSGGSGPNAGAGAGGGAAGAAGAGGAITVWLAGDSTVANGETPCPVGWGKVFAPLFDQRVTVQNSAAGGRSVRTWLYSVQKVMDASGECVLDTDSTGEPVVQARWSQMLTGMKPGDYLLIQFGINDGDPSCDRHVGLDAFKESYGMMAQAAKARGARPVFITPVSAISCKNDVAQGTRGAYVTATIDAGSAFDVPVIDLHARSVALYDSLGFCPVPGGDVSASTTGPVGDFFCDDHTHFETAGAQQIAGLVAQALADQALPLAAHLK